MFITCHLVDIIGCNASAGVRHIVFSITYAGRVPLVRTTSRCRNTSNVSLRVSLPNRIRLYPDLLWFSTLDWRVILLPILLILLQLRLWRFERYHYHCYDQYQASCRHYRYWVVYQLIGYRLYYRRCRVLRLLRTYPRLSH